MKIPSLTRLLFLSCTGLLLIVFSAGVVLVINGLHIDQVSFFNIHIQNLSLVWDKGLNLDVTRIQVDDLEEKHQTTNWKMVRRGLRTAHYLGQFFASFTIESFQYKGYKGRFFYQQQEAGNPLVFTLNSADLHLSATLMEEEESLRIILNSFSSTVLQSSLSGSFLVDPTRLQLTGSLSADLARCLPVELTVKADLKGIFFQGQGNGVSTTITPLVDLFDLDPAIQRWITDYLKGSRYQLQEVSGRFPWDDPAALLHTLTASIRVDDTEYTFAQGLEPIKAAYTELNFSRGMLKIIPHKSSFYSQDGGRSWLDINFNDPDNILLTAYIKTRAKVNADIINLLNYYNISLPLVQKKGTVVTDLTLAVNLNKTRVKAEGIFDVGESVFLYGGQRFRVKKGRVELKGTDVVIKGLKLSSGQLFSGRVDGLMNLKEARTEFEITLDSVVLPLKKTSLMLDSRRGPLQLNYHNWAGQGTVTAKPSHWLFGTQKLALDAFTASFDVQDLSGTLPPTRLVISSAADLLIGGKFNGSRQLADMDVTLRSLQTPSLALAQESLPLSVHYHDRQLQISGGASSWLFAGRELIVSPFTVRYADDELKLEQCQIKSTDFFDTLISGNFDLNKGVGNFFLDGLSFAQKDRPPLLNFPSELTLDMEMQDGESRIHLDELGFYLRSVPQGGWDVIINDFSKLLQHSRLLRRLKVKSGSLHLVTASPTSPLQFSGELVSSYDFLVQNGQPQSAYVFSGHYDESGLELVINKDLNILFSDRVVVTSHNLGYNVPDFLRFREDRDMARGASADTNVLPEIILQASDTFLFFREGNSILADTMKVTARGDALDLKITHEQGEITAHAVGDTFSLQGQKLGGTFMSALSLDAVFEGGFLTAVAEGTFDRFTAVFSTGRILLKKYILLNNILAVINTLPALVNFSLPKYDHEGWPVDSIRFWFDYDKGLATVKTLELDSAEMDMRGSGTMDFLKKQVDLEVNLITQAGKNMSKIPLVGYILAGDEQRPTLTFHVTGDLLNPTVDNTAFQEVLAIPFEVLLRTLATPFKWAGDLIHTGDLEPDGKDNQEENQPAEVN